MADKSYLPNVYKEQGGARLVVASSGSLDVESGGEIDIESGGALKIAGTAITASADEINALATQQAFTADTGGVAQYDIVFVSGWDGTNTRVKMDQAKADSADTSEDLYWVDEAVLVGVAGNALRHGYFTSGLSGTTGDKVYLSDQTAGAVTLTEPTGGDIVRIVGSLLTTGASGVVHIDLSGESIQVHDHADAAGGGTLSTPALTGTTADGFEFDVGGTVPNIKIAVGATTGNYSQTIKPADTLTSSDADITIPDTAGVDHSFALINGSNKLLNSITDITNAQHDHSSAATGGTLASILGLSGTTGLAFEVDTDGTLPAIAIGVGTTGDFTQTIKPAAVITSSDVDITIPDTAGAAGVFVLEGISQTLTNKTLTAPTINAGTITGTVTITTPTVIGTWANLGSVTTCDINGGAIDGAIIGAATPAAITGVTVTGTTITDGTFSVSAGAITGVKNITSASGAYAVDYSSASGTFKTSTGTNTLSGDIEVAANKDLQLLQGTGYFLINAETNGSLKILPTAATAQAVVLSTTAQTSSGCTVSIPNMAGQSSEFVMTHTAQSIAGIKTFTDNTVMDGITGGDVDLDITAAAGSASNGKPLILASGAGAGAGNAGGIITGTTGAGVAGSGGGTGGASGAATITSGAAGTETTGTAGASGAITVSSAVGGAASGNDGTGGAGGLISITGGAGGACAAANGGETGGVGASINIYGGAGGDGTQGAGTDGDGGSVTIRAGVGDTNGTISIGGTSASAVAIGRTGVTTSLHGTVSLADGATPILSIASGGTNTGYIEVLGKTDGGLKIISADSADYLLTMSLATQTGGVATLTIPDLANTAANMLVSGQASIVNADVHASAGIVRSKLAQDALAIYTVPLTAMRIWDAQDANLPDTAAADDMALVSGTFGTACPTLQGVDFQSTTSDEKSRFQFALPAEYDDGETVTLRLGCAMLQNISDTSCDVDVECFLSDRDGAVGSDICATVAQSINSVTPADQDFTITPTGLVPGDLLDIRLAFVGTDGSGSSPVIPEISQVEFLLDIKG